MEIEGIDTKVGMVNVNYDEELYQEILTIYVEDGEEILRILRENIQKTDLKLFTTHVHAMKSASHGIGAVELSERFKELEFAGKGADMDKIDKLLPTCLQMLEKLINDIKTAPQD